MLSTSIVCIIAFAVLLVLLAASSCYADEYFDIYNEWNVNPFKAERKWTEQTITFKGEIFHMGKDDDGMPCVGLVRTVSNSNDEPVFCMAYFNSEEMPEKLFEIEKGETIKVKGVVLGLGNNDGNLVISIAGEEIL